jgi:hypothetical protein
VVEAASPVLLKLVTFAPTVPICEKVLLFFERSILKPVSFVALSAQVRFTLLAEAAVATKFVGGTHVGMLVLT